MSIYVDPLAKTTPTPQWPWARKCWLYGDVIEQVHAVAEKLNIKPQFFVDNPDFPRYELKELQRAEAIKAGAIEHSRWECIFWVRRRYEARRGSL